MRKLRVLSLFAGIGGFDLGLERTGGFETVAFCEIEPFCQKVLRKHWPEVPIYDDVRALTADALERDGIAVDVITGGFPCQPFSTASHGVKVAEDMWPEMARLIAEIRPSAIMGENVDRRVADRGADYCRSIGYGAIVKRVGADDCGADHKRGRWWFCAHSDHESKLHRAINAEVAKLPKLCEGVWGAENYARAVRISNGFPNRVDRNRALGNAVIPFIPYALGRAILQAEKGREAA